MLTLQQSSIPITPVGALSDSRDSIERLMQMCEEIESVAAGNVEIAATFLHPCCVAYLRALFDNPVLNQSVRVHTTKPVVNRYLADCGFPYLSSVTTYGPSPDSALIIPLIAFDPSTSDLADAVTRWAVDSICPLMPELSQPLERKIVKNIWEIVNNAVTHSRTNSPIYACGQFYPKKGCLEVAFVDRGIGICTVVRDFGLQLATDHECIEWALGKGNTTRPAAETGGSGLYVLKQFLEKNGGLWQIASGEGYYRREGAITTHREILGRRVHGTLVSMRIVADGHRYFLQGEES